MLLQKWMDLLPADAKKICFVGGGGKTGRMLGLAGEYAGAGRRVVITTTTHMFYPGTDQAVKERQYPSDMAWIILGDGFLHSWDDFVEMPSASSDELWISCKCSIRRWLDEGRMVFAAAADPEKSFKVMSLPERYLDDLCNMGDICLIEGDGSARKPVKIPRSHEPVVPSDTHVTVAVVGMSCLGSVIRDCAYAAEELACFLHKKMEDRIDCQDLIRILTEERGLRKGCSGQYYVILNQADTAEQRTKGEEILKALEIRGIRGHMMSRREKLGLVLLAAGLGRRFLGQEKMQARLSDGRPLYLAAVEKAERVAACRHVLVTRDEIIAKEIGQRPLPGGDSETAWTTVINPRPERGIASSMQCGIQASGQVDGWLFMVCDQPGLTQELIERMVEAWREGRGDILSARCRGIPGNPKLFSSFFCEELMSLSGDVGGRQIIQNYRDALYFVDTEDPEELFDVDTKEDLDKVTKMH